MDIRRLDDRLSVSPQVMPADMAAIAGAGFRSVPCNRPDGEGADHWRRQGVLRDIDIRFCSAAAALFGVADYVPAPMEYVRTYGIHLHFGETLAKVDGPARVATFARTGADGTKQTVERGRIVLAEFAYGGKLAPTFPAWPIDGRKPSRLAWYLKARLLPPPYWKGMLKGRERLTQPTLVD